MNLLKDNFKLIFVISAMVIIGVGTLIYDVNKPSLSGGVADIIKIGDTALIRVGEGVNFRSNFDNFENVEYVCSIDNDEIATIDDCEVSAIKVGVVNLKIEAKDTTNGEVLDEKTVAITINKGSMVITGVPSELTLKVGEEFVITHNSNIKDYTFTHEYDKTMFKVEKNEDNLNTLIALKEGTATFKIIFTPVEQDKYESTEKTINITVYNTIEPTIKVNDIEMFVGETKEIDVDTNNIQGGLNFSTNDDSIVSLDGMKVTGLKEGTATLSVTFEPTDTDKYKSVTKEFKVTVKTKVEETEIDKFVNGMKKFLKDNTDGTGSIEYDKDSKMVILSYCENGCSTSKPDSTIKLKYDEGTGILKFTNSIPIFKNNLKDFTNEYGLALSLLLYVEDTYNIDSNKIDSCINENMKNGKNSCILTIKNNGLILLYDDYFIYDNSSDTNIYFPKTFKNLEIDIRNGIKNSTIYKIDTNAKNGTVLVDNVKNVNGKDIITLKVKANDKYGFDSLTIKDKNKKDITKDVNYNSSTMTFEMPSSDVIVDATFITNAKTGVNDLTMLLAITMVVFGLGLYIVRKNVNSLEI